MVPIASVSGHSWSHSRLFQSLPQRYQLFGQEAITISDKYGLRKPAGEPIHGSAMSDEENRLIEAEFSAFRDARSSKARRMPRVTPAMARTHQSAAQAILPYLFQYYDGRFERSTVIKVVSTTAAVPDDLPGHIARQSEFLMGAALWLLDYLEDACDDPDEYLDLLPVGPSEDLEYDMHCADDLLHDRTTILRIATLLDERGNACRRQFRRLLDLIDDETAARLRQSFKGALLDYISRAAEIHDRLKPVTQGFPSTMEELGRQRLGMLSKRDELPEIYFLLLAPDLICHPQSKIREELRSQKAAELLAGYGVSDPYELCAAYFLLEREGDALVNLNVLTGIVMICALRHLPWAQDDFGARAGLFEKGKPDYCLRYEYSEGPTASGEDPLDFEWRLSEAQLFFLATGIILPRDRMPSDKLIRWFMRQGVEERRAHELAWAAFIAYFTESGESGWEDIDLFGDDEEDEEPISEGSVQDGPTESSGAAVALPDSGALAEQNEALARQVKELRGALHESERTSSRLREQLRESERKWEADRSELAQLRETLYRLRAEEDAEDGDSAPMVELPWQVKRRVVVYGGHDSWRKVVKPLLPGARFYDREELTGLNTVRGADVVWLQVNAMSHKYYYRIIDAARKHGIPVRYFGSASAKKCAVQLSLDELAAERKEV